MKHKLFRLILLRNLPSQRNELGIRTSRASTVVIHVIALFAICLSTGRSLLAQSPAPFVVEGPTIIQNNCLSGCASISYPAGSPVTADGRVVQANTGNLEFDVPVVSKFPTSTAIGLQVGFAVTVTATGGASGEVQSNSARSVMNGPGSATLKIPIPVEWAESELRFQITYWMSGSKSVCTRKGCKTYPVGYSYSTTGPNLSSISLAIPAPTQLDGVVQAAGSFPADAFLVLVTPQAAFQLPLQPVAIVYSPVGNESDAVSTWNFTEISGTNLQFQNSQTQTTALTQDDTTNYQAGVSFSFSAAGGSTVKFGFNFAGSWDNSVENDSQTSTTTSVLINSQQTTKVNVGVGPFTNRPPLNKVTYSSQPFWDDMILAVANPQFAVWSYPNGPVLQPIGNDANDGFIELPISLLDACINTPTALQPNSSTPGSWQPLQVYATGSMILVENGYIQVATTGGVSGASAPEWNNANGGTTVDGGITWTNESDHLIPVGTDYEWLSSSECTNIAKVDQFYVNKNQAASPYVSVADESHSGTVSTQASTTYSSEDSFTATYTTSGSLQTTSTITSIGTSSLGLTADVSNLLQALGINLSLGTTNTTTQKYTDVNTQSYEEQQYNQNILAASNTIHDSSNPPMELAVNGLLDAYFGGMALQVPSMAGLQSSGTAVGQRPVSPAEKSEHENAPHYSTVKLETAPDREILKQAHERAALRHSADDPLPIPEPGRAVPSSPFDK